MAKRRKFSCLTITLSGCGCLVLLCLITAGFLFFMASGAELAPPEFSDVEVSESIFNPENGLNLGEESQKPVLLVLDLNQGEFELRPDGQNSQIQIDGNYDQANFELKTEAVDEGKHIKYKISFKPRKKFGLFESGEANNKIVVHLPPELQYALEGELNMGEFDFDISGLSMALVDMEASMGAVSIYSSQANQTEMESVFVDMSMGELVLGDVNNFRTGKVSTKMRMGEAKVIFSDTIEKDCDVSIKVNMGEGRVVVPEGMPVESSLKAKFGEARNIPDREGQGGKLKVKGSASLGEVNIITKRND